MNQTWVERAKKTGDRSYLDKTAPGRRPVFGLCINLNLRSVENQYGLRCQETLLRKATYPMRRAEASGWQKKYGLTPEALTECPSPGPLLTSSQETSKGESCMMRLWSELLEEMKRPESGSPHSSDDDWDPLNISLETCDDSYSGSSDDDFYATSTPPGPYTNPKNKGGVDPPLIPPPKTPKPKRRPLFTYHSF